MTDRAGTQYSGLSTTSSSSRTLSGMFVKGTSYKITDLETQVYTMLARNSSNTNSIAWTSPIPDWDGVYAGQSIMSGSAIVTSDEYLQPSYYSPQIPQYFDTSYSPVGLWNFNNTMQDMSGHGLHLTAIGTPRYTVLSGTPFIGFLSNGSNAMYRTVHDSLLTIIGAITIEFVCWVPTTGNGAICAFGASGESSDTNFAYQVTIGGPTNPLSMFTENNSGYNDIFDSNTYIYTPTATHVAVTRSSDGSTIKLYINGVLQETSTGHTAPTDASSGQLYVCSGVGGGYLYNGAVTAMLKICASELTAAQIQAEYMRTLGPIYGPTVWT